MSLDKAQIPVLKRSSRWREWARRMRGYLMVQHKLHRWLTEEPDKGKPTEIEKDETCKNIILMFVDASLGDIVENAASTKLAWEKLQKEVEEGEGRRALSLLTDIACLNMKHKGGLKGYILETQELFSRVQEAQNAEAGHTLCTKFVVGLAPEVKSVIGAALMCKIEEMEDHYEENDIKFEDVEKLFTKIISQARTLTSVLIPESTAERKITELPEDAARVFAGRGQNFNDTRVCYNCGEMGHIARFCPRPRNNQSYSQHQCGFNNGAALPPYRGHTFHPHQPFYPGFNGPSRGQEPRPPKMATHQGQARNQQPTTKNHPHDKDGNQEHHREAHMLAMNGDSGYLGTVHFANGTVREDLLFDGGATHHIVCNSTFVSNFRPSAVKHVTVGGGIKHCVHGEGEVYVRSPDTDRDVILSNVLVVPSMHMNVVSQNQLSLKGLTTKERGGELCVYDSRSRSIILTAKRVDLLIWLEGKIDAPSASMHAIVSFDLLHKRLGHAGERPTRELINKKIVHGWDEIRGDQLNACIPCEQSKQTRVSCKPNPDRAKEPLHVVHSDVIELPVASLGGNRYAVTLLDEFSGFVEVVPITHKSDVPDVIIETLTRWQRQTGYGLKLFRSDGGGEYVNARTSSFLQREGAVHGTSTARMPQQNGRAERLNRTLLERTRALLAQFNHPKELWGEAIQTAAYTMNMIPKAGRRLTPIEYMFGERPDIRGLRVFGCKARVHHNGYCTDKLDPKSYEGIFVGYLVKERTQRIYRVLTWDDNGNPKVVKSCNVQFFEDMPGRYGSHVRNDHCVTFRDQLDATIDQESMQAEVSEVRTATDIDEYLQSSTSEWSLSDYGNEDAVLTQVDHEEQVQPGWLKRSDRDRHPPAHLQSFLMNIAQEHGVKDEFGTCSGHAFQIYGNFDTPPTIQQALSRPDADNWREAMHAELQTLLEKGVYSEIPTSELPPGKKPIPTKMVLLIKRDAHGDIEKYKARLVAKGFLQKEGKDYEEVYAPTAQGATFRLIMAIAAQQHWEIQQIDVESAFLNGELVEEIYIKPPECLVGSRIWRLHKALYGLKQAARVWNEKLREEMLQLGFFQCESDPCLFIRGSSSKDTVYALFHVDDAVIIGSESAVQQAKNDLFRVGSFKIKDLGPAKFFLGISIERRWDGILLHQSQYTEDILQQYSRGQNGKTTPMTPGLDLSCEHQILSEDNNYRALVGSLLYLSVNTRPDITYSVGILSRYLSNPNQAHERAAQRVLRYLKRTPKHGILLTNSRQQTTCDIEIHCDADFAGEVSTRKSTTGMMIQYAGQSPIIWSSKRQAIVTTSTTEAEYVASCSAVKEGLWLSKLFSEILKKKPSMRVSCDNMAAIHLVRNRTAGVHGRSKHIGIQYHFLRDRFMRGDFLIQHVDGSMQKADILTKALPEKKFEPLRKELGVIKAGDSY